MEKQRPNTEPSDAWMSRGSGDKQEPAKQTETVQLGKWEENQSGSLKPSENLISKGGSDHGDKCRFWVKYTGHVVW